MTDGRTASVSITLRTQLQGRNCLCSVCCWWKVSIRPKMWKNESNDGNFVKAIKPHSVSVIYSYRSDLQRENEVDMVNVCREHLCRYLLLNVDNCTRWHSSSSSTTIFLCDLWQSTNRQINIHSETSNSRSLSLASEQQWNVIYVNRKVCSVVTRS